MTYYIGEGKNQKLYEDLYTKLVEKAVKYTPQGQALHAATVIYFDRLGNGGVGELPKERKLLSKFAQLLPAEKAKLVKSLANKGRLSADKAEKALDEIVLYVGKLQDCISDDFS